MGEKGNGKEQGKVIVILLCLENGGEIYSKGESTETTRVCYSCSDMN